MNHACSLYASWNGTHPILSLLKQLSINLFVHVITVYTYIFPLAVSTDIHLSRFRAINQPATALSRHIYHDSCRFGIHLNQPLPTFIGAHLYPKSHPNMTAPQFTSLITPQPYNSLPPSEVREMCVLGLRSNVYQGSLMGLVGMGMCICGWLVV